MTGRFRGGVSGLAIAIAFPAALISADIVNAAEIALEEIVVTAQRRAQSLQEVPISVTSFDAAALRTANITTARDYLAMTPNVTYSDDGQVGNRGVSISIRGVGDVKSLDNSVINSVGVYLDEFSVASVSTGTINPQLQDMERIEVLRGPQGTYFGRNALGGALNLTTKKPVGVTEGEVIIGGELFDGGGATESITGILNVPLSETFWIRAVTHLETSTGFVKNINPQGTPNSGWDSYHGRMSARWMASDKTTVDLQLFHTKDNEGHDPTVNSGVLDLDTKGTFGGAVTAGVTPYGSGLGYFPNNLNRVNHNSREYNKNDSTLINLRVNHELSSNMTLRSITGYLGSNTKRRFDQDRSDLDIVTRETDFDGTSWSQELRLETRMEKYDLVVGGLYAKDKMEHISHIFMGEDRAISGVGVLPPVVAFPPGTPQATINKDTKYYSTESMAAFADFTWRPVTDLEVNIGGRYTHDEIEAGKRDVFVFGGAPLPDVYGKKVFKDFSPRVALRYKVAEDASVYGTVSKGYKAGGVNVGHLSSGTTFSDPFKGEKLWNYEVGFKSEWLDNRLRLNVSAFYLDWKNLQLQTFFLLDPTNISSQVELTHNTKKARSMGVEAEFAAVLAKGLTLSGGVGYLDAQIKSHETIVITGEMPVNVHGLSMPKSPKWTGNLIVEYHFDTALGDSYVRADWTHRSSAFSDIEALAYRQLGLPAFPYKVPSFDVFGLRGGFTWDERINVNLYVENLFEEKYYTSTGENFGLGGIRLRPNPRTFGMNIGWKFN